DIPFDLKHRQHTVYGGKIELLRTELASKLQWAIAESRRQRKPAGPERFSLRLAGIEIPDTGVSIEVPEVRSIVPSSPFYLPMQLRNDSLEISSGITHVYLFSAKDSVIIPCRDASSYAEGFWGGHVTTYRMLGQRGPGEEPVALEPLIANPVDSGDGLTRQYRVGITFPALPSGAVEVSRMPLMLKAGVLAGKASFRLRLHSAAQYHEYKFRLSIQLKVPDAKEATNKTEIEELKDEIKPNGGITTRDNKI
ncbi:MAG: hypothetical protein M3362_14005, partial [Acidobacteriota bacterium]|nr:hypothetical protein [Acidobacteriota bacterium]